MSRRRTPHQRGRNRRDEAVSRREFVQRIALMSAVSGVAITPVIAAPIDRVDRAWMQTGDPSAVLSRLLDYLIPACRELPAAGDLGVAGFIERARKLAPHLDTNVALVLASLPVIEVLARWSESEWDARVGDIARRDESAFNLLLQAAYTGYYSHPDVLAALGWRDPADTGTSGSSGWFDETLLTVALRTPLPPA